jgi:hypothetical protein
MQYNKKNPKNSKQNKCGGGISPKHGIAIATPNPHIYGSKFEKILMVVG